MTEPSRRPRYDAMRAAAFRDEARAIVRQDRAERKAGRSVDTSGAIARALERAYRLGFEEAQTGQRIGLEPPPGTPIVWDLIPPRPRSALWGICVLGVGEGNRPERAMELVPAMTERGTPGWRRHEPGRANDGTVYGASTIAVLVRLGLLVPAGAEAMHLVLSELGRATWRMAIEVAGGYPTP